MANCNYMHCCEFYNDSSKILLKVKIFIWIHRLFKQGLVISACMWLLMENN